MTIATNSEGEGLRAAVCAVVGLACMFGGIWLSDAQFLAELDIQGEGFAIRACSLVVYAVFFLVAWRYAKRDALDVRWLFGAASIAGLVLFALGATVIFAVLPDMAAGSGAYQATGLAALLLVKVVGAPVSIGLVCVFARLGPAGLMRSCTLGMLGAFALYTLVSLDGIPGMLGPVGVVAVSGGLLAVSLLAGALGMGGVPSARLQAAGSQEPVPAALVVPGVVKRPWGKVMTPGFVIMVAFSAMMLGFLRNGFGGSDPHTSVASFAVLLILLAVAALWRGLRIEHVFYTGLLCTAVGILLAPALDYATPGASSFLCGVGTALFEVVSWALVVWAARNCMDTLLAAAGARLATVVGHLLGTVVVAVGFALSASSADALHASELLLMLVYMVFLVLLLKFPGLQAPFSSPSAASEYDAVAAVSAGVQAPVAVPAGAQAAAPEPEAPPAASDDLAPTEPGESEEPALPADEPLPTEKELIEHPCDVIAATYGLTAREREVLGLIARGRNMPFMEETLFISRNTLKMHIRHIYTKLDVHSKQDIIDMVEAIVGERA